uniref:Ribosomal protein L6 n=1 Tax=Malawimonas californiana TaxID=221722 RepID=A0A0B5GCQ5_MALCL|nr:ribosomal protein L6 [Malawimonas californiana]AJF22871.1 ribosomal protein L6 [Malawimonas californiana]
MSNIGKIPILIPNDVNIMIVDNYITIQGNMGISVNSFPNGITIAQKNNLLYIKTINREYDAVWGTFRSLIKNMIIGVTKGYIIKLKIIGIGYKASIIKNTLRLKIGYTNPMRIRIPLDVKIKCVRNTIIYLYSSNLQKIKEFATLVRSYKKPDPYKGKGIRFFNEVVVLKEGKKKTK